MVSATEARKSWLNIRTQFGKKLALEDSLNQTRSGQAPQPKKTIHWTFMDDLSFLRKHVLTAKNKQ